MPYYCPEKQKLVKVKCNECDLCRAKLFSSKSNFNDLPIDTVEESMRFMPWETFKNFSQTNKIYYEQSREKYLHRYIELLTLPKFFIGKTVLATKLWAKDGKFFHKVIVVLQEDSRICIWNTKTDKVKAIFCINSIGDRWIEKIYIMDENSFAIITSSPREPVSFILLCRMNNSNDALSTKNFSIKLKDATQAYILSLKVYKGKLRILTGKKNKDKELSKLKLLEFCPRTFNYWPLFLNYSNETGLKTIFAGFTPKGIYQIMIPKGKDESFPTSRIYLKLTDDNDRANAQNFDTYVPTPIYSAGIGIDKFENLGVNKEHVIFANINPSRFKKKETNWFWIWNLKNKTITKLFKNERKNLLGCCLDGDHIMTIEIDKQNKARLIRHSLATRKTYYIKISVKFEGNIETNAFDLEVIGPHTYCLLPPAKRLASSSRTCCNIL